jgi:predicted DNA-binding protein (MmcQ/YjbR family)
MTWETLLAYCLAKPGGWQDEPWEGDDASYSAIVSKLPKKDRPLGGT